MRRRRGVVRGMRGLGIGIRTLVLQERLAWLSALVLLGVHDVALAAHRLWHSVEPEPTRPGTRRAAQRDARPVSQSAGDAMRCCGEEGWFDVFRKVRSNVREAGGTAGRLSGLA